MLYLGYLKGVFIIIQMVMEYKKENFKIKSWAESDRPREKLILKGKSNLSDAELIAILLGSGSREDTAVSLSQKLLNSVDNNLHELGKANLSELQKFKGIGEAKAISITAALELGRRRSLSEIPERYQIVSSNDAYVLLSPHMRDLRTEVFKLVLLNQRNALIRVIELSHGGIAGTVVDPKVVFKNAIDNQASCIILAHNHPSGNLTPSQSDIQLTKKIVDGGKMLDIRVLDHVIISERGYFSFADEGMI